MASPNPYATPKAQVADASGADHEALRSVASGQKLIIYSILLSLAGFALAKPLGMLVLALNLAAAIMSIVGAVRIAGGLGQGTGAKILYVIAMLIPLISLIIMITLSIRATRALREGGYEVGLLGARNMD
jgi:hypothetical protein